MNKAKSKGKKKVGWSKQTEGLTFNHKEKLSWGRTKWSAFFYYILCACLWPKKEQRMTTKERLKYIQILKMLCL